ncbi:short-subunit dehydrogenase [Microbacteriaceae bacterium SG_E_30_P1]|uniref:Short-subunit dehydrogenase n=1 Tax=Antiquaquibacter oligotrophicus TaxID=2880260 RepID=A0ABT6KMW3_9MICO|nr:SDR family NAD(P)-dependent oxidoreductase [Antiquaquibacter oligotrophicus]MDH6181189.1 short-subunit dehydrogenase [Antiquaquibacter oligotrophicus]UDF13116.1 SDR family NAD(P)-dependent oxidoreductase [Antiquaquibacter oligotrophicus]
MATALVTGGTSGIGAEFARQLATRGFDLVLVARDRERLDVAQGELHAAAGISVETVRADLADREDLARVAAIIADPDREIDFVVNNAGFGIHTPLATLDTSVHEHGVDVMVRAVLVLSAAAARTMSGRGRGTILNVSSLQSQLTTGSYSAIKAWVTSFTQSLAVELKGSGVRVTALLPGWVSTEWHSRAGVRTSSIPDWLWTTPEAVVTSALRDAERGRIVSIPTVRYRVLGWFARYLPRRTVRWISGKISARRREPAQSTPSSEHPVTADGDAV